MKRKSQILSARLRKRFFTLHARCGGMRLLLFLLLFLPLSLHAQITGYIIDAATGDSTPFASAIHKGHGGAVGSKINGHYSIPRHNGWQLTFSSVGYEPKVITINASTPSKLNIKLKPDTKMLKEVTVRSKKQR